MSNDRVKNWQVFARHMEQYIKERTVSKYSSDRNGGIDFMAITGNPHICIWNVLKYGFRIWRGRMKEHDLEKIVHYAEMAWTMSMETTVIDSSRDKVKVSMNN